MSRAFTLVETLVTLGLLSLLVAAMFISIGHVADRREQLATWAEAADGVDVLFAQIEAATRSTFVRSDEPGVRGGADTLRLAWHEDAVDTPDEPWFEIRPHGEGGLVATNARGEERFAFAVQRIRFRYLAEGSWIERFDSRESNALPSAIEVAVWTQDGDIPTRVRVFGVLEGQTR